MLCYLNSKELLQIVKDRQVPQFPFTTVVYLTHVAYSQTGNEVRWGFRDTTRISSCFVKYHNLFCVVSWNLSFTSFSFEQCISCCSKLIGIFSLEKWAPRHRRASGGLSYQTSHCQMLERKYSTVGIPKSPLLFNYFLTVEGGGGWGRLQNVFSY